MQCSSLSAFEGGEEFPGDAFPAYPQTLVWILLAVFLLLSGFFSGSETALFSLDRIRLSKLEHTHPHGHLYTKTLLNSPQKTLTSILFLNRFSNIGATLAAGALAGSYFSAFPILGFIIGALGVTLLILFLGEIMPKTLAIERNQSFALFSAPLLLLFIRIVLPLRYIIDLFTGVLFRILQFKPMKKEETTSEEDLKMMLMSGEFDGLLEEDERDMIDGIFEFGEKIAEDIMTPRTDLEAYPNTLSQEELIQATVKGNHSRVLIYEEDIDHVAGVLHVKDFLLNPNRRFVELIREPYIVTPKKKLTRLLREMQKKRTHLAIVVDEYGGTAGIVTLNTLLEEIVGEIKDVREAAHSRSEILRIGPDHYNVAGKTEVKELNENLGMELEEAVSRTLSGFVFNTLGHLPSEGEKFEKSGWQFRIIKMDGNRIQRIVIKKKTPPQESLPEGSEGKEKVS